ncbi:MAG: 16S rRNA (guanine(527)-N(7))-methyltransferase RsmG [Flammeovirgaceae bacterium]|nr:16S rRNA (guanine(527)-N(7))-methyltransferase RsmG [Flammeovirgaceae bacterium]
MEVIAKYFPDLTKKQRHQFGLLHDIYSEWNEKINVISRKDIDNLYLHHVLHSLSIAKYVDFKENTKLLDVGTGGGFPGIPLAILYPHCQFHLVDSIAKKIKVVEEVSKHLGLENITYEHQRAEKVKGQFDFVITRAVAKIDTIYNWVKGKVRNEGGNVVWNGIICLKGGDLKEEFSKFKHNYRFVEISDYFEEEFFETKKIVYVPA